MIGHYYYLSRILDIPCRVCGDFSSGKHYNIFACDGCAGFFKRSIRSNRQYICRAAEKGRCIIDKTHRNQCRACRLRKCQVSGMNKDAVQHERGSRKTTSKPQEHSNNINRTKPVLGTSSDALKESLPKIMQREKFQCRIIPFPENYWNNNYILSQFASQRLFPSPTLNLADLSESAAQLLFMNVQWAKSITSFAFLPFCDQLLLIEESWRELFILGAAQFLPFMELSSLIYAWRIFEPCKKHSGFLRGLQKFHHILASVRQFQLDQHEFSYLRAIVLFKTSFTRQNTQILTHPASVAYIQDDTHLKLSKYTSAIHPEQPLRFGKLLLTLPSLRSISEDTIEEFFFRKTIGNVPIVKIISDMYKTQYIMQNT